LLIFLTIFISPDAPPPPLSADVEDEASLSFYAATCPFPHLTGDSPDLRIGAFLFFFRALFSARMSRNAQGSLFFLPWFSQSALENLLDPEVTMDAAF